MVAFPYTDMDVFKRRRAVVLTAASANETALESLVAMITTAQGSQRDNDVQIIDMADTGLRAPSVVRMRFQSIGNQRIGEPIGHLSLRDRASVRAALASSITI